MATLWLADGLIAWLAMWKRVFTMLIRVAKWINTAIMESLKNARIVCCCGFAEVVPLWHTATKKIFMLPTRSVGGR